MEKDGFEVGNLFGMNLFGIVHHPLEPVCPDRQAFLGVDIFGKVAPQSKVLGHLFFELLLVLMVRQQSVVKPKGWPSFAMYGSNFAFCHQVENLSSSFEFRASILA